MKNRKRKRRLRLLAMLAAVLLACEVPAEAAGFDEAGRSLLTTAEALVDQGLEENSSTIQILLQQCLDVLPEGDPAETTLKSILMLLETGNADAASVAVLLRSVIDQTAEGLPEMPETEKPAAETAAETVPETEKPAAETAAETVPETEKPAAETVLETAPEEPQETIRGELVAEEPPQFRAGDLPFFEVTAFIPAILQNSVLVDVPGDWGNNASGRALTSYSPVNGSGAISPAAGTLSLSYFPTEGESDNDAFSTYIRNIENMSVTTALTFEDISMENLPARKIDFTMNVGAHQFTCETVCFAHEGTIYSIELMQGPQTSYDYFPVYRQVANSAEIGNEQSISAALERIRRTEEGEPEATAAVSETQQTETTAVQVTETRPAETAVVQVTETQPEETTAVQVTETQPAETAAVQITETQPAETTAVQETEPPLAETVDNNPFPGDIGTFRYQLKGHVYQFPTSVGELTEGDLPLNRTLDIPYDFRSDADLARTPWTEIVNTQYYYFENALYKEMAAVTNLTGDRAPMTDCVLTALIDTQGEYVDILLPGGVHVGSAESDILKGFPEFSGMALDGYAAFRGNELLYACNVRDDGCNGYVLIRNDAPYYSAVSIICENQVVKEISFECLGSVRAQGVFLDE